MSRPSEVLQAGLNFTPEDLAANREGRLGEAQIARRQFSGWAFCGYLFPIIAILVAGLIGLVVLNASAWLIVPVCLVTGFLTMGQSLYIWALRVADAETESGIVHSFTGMITDRSVVKERYYIHLESQRFFVPPGAYEAFEIGQTYHLYYLPRTGILLSAELAVPGEYNEII